MAKQDTFARYTIRIPAQLYERLKEVADHNNRSLNNEISERLAFSFSAATQLERAADNEGLLLALVADIRRSQETLDTQAQQLADLAEHYADERDGANARVAALEAKLAKLKAR